ncbi:sugar transporter SWEET1-like [Colletes gigas]|uniref:sugar transporter SWEET1-like n=1 Tax=Colletes gigas TaxID=935657 RepID=UPI001C9B44BC|nr:sugar transporter SWEET1-like [Colletes gigas]XP_043263429.1 sugar transporter SWEET1-like [Colletes gigas]XP_043264241.1 sugar transporter SWEET1-like [Colletes gigas]XP_043264242.1 sugar transporter SWEET1-like [Colletes gigas]
MGLEDYKEVVGTCASITTMGQMLAGTLICKDIYQKGSSKGVDPMPFLGGVGMCILMLQYAFILKDPTMINVNVFGLLTNAMYMAAYYYFTPNTKDTLALIGKVTAFVVVFLAYAQVENSEKIEFRFGLIVTGLLLSLIASPLVHLGDVVKTKNTDILPFPLIFMGTLVSFQWLLYGVIINNGFVIFQNAVGFFLSAVQLSLFAIFPSKSKANPASQKKTK